MKIPRDIADFIENEGIVAVGTVGGNRLVNVSPRIFFIVCEDAIYWLDFFKHKSYRNYQVNPWVTVASYNKEKLSGFQLRGIVSFITDEPLRSDFKRDITEKTLARNSSEKIKELGKKDAEIIQFEPRVIYSLNPKDYTDLSIGSDVDSANLFEEP